MIQTCLLNTSFKYLTLKKTLKSILNNLLHKGFIFCALVFFSLFNNWVLASNDADDFQEIKISRDAYRHDLNKFRKTYQGSYHLPKVDFYLFGMGFREKFIYKNGAIYRAITGEIVQKWDVEEEIIAPHLYTVAIKSKDGKYSYIVEDEVGVYIKEKNTSVYLTKSPVNLPTFNGYKHSSILRVLHQELLVNIIDGKPVPNFLVYPKPWYRDSAMMAMTLKKTGNLDLIKQWILNLREPYDNNNKGVGEADNLGQVLYLISLVSNKSHPLVPVIKKELKQWEKKSWFSNKVWIEGYSDYKLHPVYQTKWAKFGLKSLHLPDPYTVPQVEDSYAALFWWDYKNLDSNNQPTLKRDNYPYLQWASNHYAQKKEGLISDRDYPLTWEANASEANYKNMALVSSEYVKLKVAAPHTWHAAEAFLSLLEAH